MIQEFRNRYDSLALSSQSDLQKDQTDRAAQEVDLLWLKVTESMPRPQYLALSESLWGPEVRKILEEFNGRIINPGTALIKRRRQACSFN